MVFRGIENISKKEKRDLMSSLKLQNGEYFLAVGTLIADVSGFMPKGSVKSDKNPGGRVLVSCGGAARNVSENLARLQIPVKIISAVGGDMLGSMLLSETAKSGVDTSHIKVVAGESSAVYMCVFEESGELSTGITDLSIAKYKSTDYFNEKRDVIAGAKAIIITEPGEGIHEFLRENYPDIPILGDVTTVALKDLTLQNIDRYHTLKANEMETEAITGISVIDEQSLREAAMKIYNMGVKNVIITLGEKGALFYNGEEFIRRKSDKKISVASVNGAGDAFFAGYIYALSQGYDTDYAMRFAMAAAEITLGSEKTIVPEISKELIEEGM